MNPLFNDEFHATIEPVLAGAKRPTWSVLIPTFNCAKHLKEALSSVLQQDSGPENMEILVIDDHSTEDDPKAVVDEIGQGRVIFIRQPHNVGKVRNYETGLRLSRGFLIHQLHGDDKIEKGFYSKMTDLFGRFHEAGAAFCQSFYMNESGVVTGRTGEEQSFDGLLNNWFEKIATGQRIQTPSIVVKRHVYEELGGYDTRFECSEDWEMWIRIAAYFPFAYTPSVLSYYRCSSKSMAYLRNKIRLKTHRALIARTDQLFKNKLNETALCTRSSVQAFYWLSYIPELIKERNLILYLRVISEALHYSLSVRTLNRAFRLTVRSLISDLL